MADFHRTLVVVFFFLCSGLALAENVSHVKAKDSDSRKSISFGHNLSPTTEILNARLCTAGFYFTGCGATDQLTLGFSPWMLSFYNLENLVLKYQHSFENLGTFSHQLAYFNSNAKLGLRYKQKSFSYWFSHATLNMDPYKMYSTFNYMYFFTEESPFSLRREPFNKQAAQFTFSTLHQFVISEKTNVNLELGVLGLNYAFPNLIAGASWEHRPNENWSIQLGGSISKRLTDPSYMDPNQMYIREIENYFNTSVHPEMQIQYWF